VLNVVLEIVAESRRRDGGSTVASAQTTYRSVTNAKSVSDELEQGMPLFYDNATFIVSYASSQQPWSTAYVCCLGPCCADRSFYSAHYVHGQVQ
jgi:hypothetical protein